MKCSELDQKNALLDARLAAIEARNEAGEVLRTKSHKVFAAPKVAPPSDWRDMGEFGLAVKSAFVSGGRDVDKRLMTKAPSGLSEALGSDGGFLVPPEFSQQIFSRVYDADNLLGRTDGYTVLGNSMSFPRSNETSRANGSRHGGIRSYWLDEGDQLTGSKPGLGRLDLKLHKLAVMSYMTDELMADAPALQKYLVDKASDEINFRVGDSVVNGPGGGQLTGILNSGCLVTVSKESGQAAATIKHENVVKMWARLFAGCRKNAVWLINQDAEPQLNTMSLGVSTAGGQLTYLPPGGLSESPYATLMGRPVIPLEYCQTLGTKGDIILADMSQFVTITHGAVESAMSIHLRFDYAETAFRWIFRVDGASWWATALTPFKGTATQSPFVCLETRS